MRPRGGTAEGYAYAANNPVSNSDPSGLFVVYGGCSGSAQPCENHPNAATGSNPHSGRTASQLRRRAQRRR